MNPLNSILKTIIAGFILAIIISLTMTYSIGAYASGTTALIVWLHVISGIVWIGILYYFNFVQVPAVSQALADTDGPGPGAINKYIAPKALAWFRYSALLTWLTGAAALEILTGGGGIINAFTLQSDTQMQILGVGAWLGTIMLFNVWVLIWPSQKKILGLCGVIASDEEKAKAKKLALMASRTNTLLSIPMLMCMIGGGTHGLGLPF